MALSKGQRIDLIKRIGQTLGAQSGADIDLTLREFGFYTPSSYNERGVRDCLQGEDDEKLLELDAYLHPTEAPIAPPQPNAFDHPVGAWSGTGFRLFLSHVHKYAHAAGALREALAARSIDAFVAHDAIEVAEEWERVILDALDSCDACLALLTDGFRESNWTDQEIGYCIARGKPMIPLEHGQMPYGFLGRYQALRVGGREPTDLALEIFELLVRKPETRDRMAQVLVDRWAATGSWEAARENYGFLKVIPHEAWTQRLVDETFEAVERNREFDDASIEWKPARDTLRDLFADTPFDLPAEPVEPVGADDDIPF